MITLLSDFGLQDASVAIAKGILLQHTPGIPIIDISHEVRPFNTSQAAYLLASSYKNFPKGTTHILLFNIFSETPNRLILSEYGGHYFLSADNGLLPLAIDSKPGGSWQCMELQSSDTFNDWLHAAGATINALKTGKPADIGLQEFELKQIRKSNDFTYDAGGLQCEVIHIDHYDNVVINFTRKQLEQLGNGRNFRLQFLGMEDIAEISSNYNDVRDGNKLCRFNNNDHLEICINRGKAASLFGLRLGGKFNDIKIFFE